MQNIIQAFAYFIAFDEEERLLVEFRGRSRE